MNTSALSNNWLSSLANFRAYQLPVIRRAVDAVLFACRTLWASIFLKVVGKWIVCLLCALSLPQLQVMMALQTGPSSLHALIASHPFLVYFFAFNWGVSHRPPHWHLLLTISVSLVPCIKGYFWVSFFAVLQQRMVWVSGPITIPVSARALMWASNQEESQREWVLHLVIQIYSALWERLTIAITLICPHLLVVFVL